MVHNDPQSIYLWRKSFQRWNKGNEGLAYLKFFGREDGKGRKRDSHGHLRNHNYKPSDFLAFSIELIYSYRIYRHAKCLVLHGGSLSNHDC